MEAETTSRAGSPSSSGITNSNRPSLIKTRPDIVQ
jgi:hypothetical protein